MSDEDDKSGTDVGGVVVGLAAAGVALEILGRMMAPGVATSTGSWNPLKRNFAVFRDLSLTGKVGLGAAIVGAGLGANYAFSQYTTTSLIER